MKFKILLALSLCATFFMHSGCSNEVEVIGIWKDIPVVYGVLNLKDSVHYVRIERAYLPPNQSALEVAQIPDSIYFDTADIDVTLDYIFQGDTLAWATPIERVELSAEGIIREPGIFAHSPSYAYKIIGGTSLPLILTIKNKKTGKTYTSSVEGVSAVASNATLFTSPAYFLTPFKPVQWRRISQQGDTVYGALTVELTKGFAAIYDYNFRFHYTEYEIDGQGNPIVGTEKAKSLEWRAASDFIPALANQTKQVVEGEAFYLFLKRSLSDVTGTNIRRCPGHLEVYVDGASTSLKDYIVARQANEGFVGGLYPADPYSNIEGGYGVFARADRLERKDRPGDPRLMRMSQLTYDYLSEGPHTSHLGFTAVPCF